ncbi:MAG TPA: hypothetical protein VM123_04135 [archaeon]|nr:hypothetical protein [archaeon]
MAEIFYLSALSTAAYFFRLPAPESWFVLKLADIIHKMNQILYGQAPVPAHCLGFP